MQYDPTYYIENLSPFHLSSSPSSHVRSDHGSTRGGSVHKNAAQGMEGTEARTGDSDSTNNNEQTAGSTTSSSFYEIPPPDVNEEDMRINGEVLQNAQDWADFLDGTRKCDFERESDYTSGTRHHYHGRHDNKRFGIHGWFWKSDTGARNQADEEEDERGVCAWVQKLGAAFFIGLIPVIGFLACFLLSYYKIFRPLSQLNIQSSQRKGLKKSMLKCVMADFVIGMMYPATPFLRLYFCSNRRMTFQARYRVVDHADRCTQAINRANAEMSAASSIRAQTLNGGADNLSSTAIATTTTVTPTDPQKRKSRFISYSNPYATVGPGTGAIRLADITKREQLGRKKSTLSAPARLEGELCRRKKSKVTKPVESWIQRMGSIWRRNAMKTVTGTDQLEGDEKIEGNLGSSASEDAAAGIGTRSKVIFSSILGPRPRRQRGSNEPHNQPKALDPLGKALTTTTALLSGKERKVSEGGCYGTGGGGMTTSQAVIDNKNFVKVSQPTIVKQQQAARDSCRRGSVVRGGTRKQWRKKQLRQQRQHYNETSIVQPQVPQLNLQNLTNEIPPVTEPKQESLVSSENVHFGSDMKIHQQPQRQGKYEQNCGFKCSGNHSRNRDSHQDCELGCRGHKVEKRQPKGILQYSTVSVADASTSGNGGIVPPVELSFVVSSAEPINSDSKEAVSARSFSVEASACSIAGKQLKKEDELEPQAQQDKVVLVIEDSDNMLIGNRTQRLPIQIQLPPPPTIPPPPLRT
ncbi:hypothetical protein BGX26_007013 [Mortierella sp. AD094]|nr:hypothetical protein BGX26_007013 [Mortierella sp. AD094]